MNARVTALSGRLLAGDIRKLAARQLVVLGLSVGLLVLLWDRFSDLNFAGIWTGIGHVTIWQWGMAACLTLASFWAVGRYDALVHAISGTAIAPKAASTSGVAAIAVAQSVGFGVLSGAFIRWRMLPTLNLVQSIRISLVVSVTFLSGWAIVTALVVVLTPAALPFAGVSLIAGAVLFTAGALILLSLTHFRLPSRVKVPPVKAMITIVFLTAIDTFMAAGALYILLPAGMQVELLVFLTAFLLALGAGLISGTPGGIGPFEVMLLSLLPHLDAQGLLSAVLAFRLVYYAIPALIGAGLAIRGAVTSAREAGPDILNPGRDMSDPALEGLIRNAPDGEAALLRQGSLSVLNGQNGASAMITASTQSLIMLRNKLDRSIPPADLITDMQIAAKARFLAPCLYKAPARLALAARQAGWQVLPVSTEAYLNPTTYSNVGSARRRLRRKLRAAAALGVTVRAATGELPITQMARINAAWAKARSGERGFSMGVWNPDLLQHAKVYLAYQNNRLIGFLTLHHNRHEQVLDLMRFTKDAPDGMMHMLLDHAIHTAGQAGVTRLSLASVPVASHPCDTRILAHLRRRLAKISGAAGLHQFKASFAPRWQTLYIAAPTRMGLSMAALDISREITRPRRPHR